MASHSEAVRDSRTTSHAENETSEGNSLAFSVIMTTVTFLLFAGGLYVMSLYTIAPVWFGVGLAMSLVALFIAFDIVPRFFSK